MKKLKTALILIFIFLASLGLSGCITREKEEKLVFWHTYQHGKEIEAINNAVKKFEKINPKIKVEVQQLNFQGAVEKFTTATAGGKGPDVIRLPNDRIGGLALDGFILPLDKYILDTSKFLPITLEAMRYNNSLYALPASIDCLALLYNVDMLKSRGYDKPGETIEEFVEQIENLTTSDIYGFAMPLTIAYWWFPWQAGYGGYIFDGNKLGIDSIGSIQATNFILSLKNRNLIPFGLKSETMDALFSTRKVAMIVEGPWKMSDFRAAKLIPGNNLGIAPLPKVKATGKYVSPLVGTKGYAISSRSENIAQAVELIKYLTNKEVQLSFINATDTLPSIKELYDEVKGNYVINGFKAQIDKGQAMPARPEMSFVWSPVDTALEKVFSGGEQPKSALTAAQKEIESKVVGRAKIDYDPKPILIGIVFGSVAVIILYIYIFKVNLREYSLKNFIRNLKGMPKEIKKGKTAYLYLLPALAAMLILTFWPTLYGFYISFTDMDRAAIISNRWEIVGINNYIAVLSTPDFAKVLITTLVWTFTNVFFHVLLGLFFAILLNKKIAGKTVYRTLLLLPWAIPTYISALVWRGMFDTNYGSVNAVLTSIGISPIDWLNTMPWALIAVIIVNVWLGFPFMMMVFSGGLQSIPQELYEAADVDGASRWEKFRFITLPLLKPTIIPAALLGTIWTFNMFNVIYLVTGGGPANATDILITYAYDAFHIENQYGFAAAYSVVIFILLLSFSIIYSKTTKAMESVY
ncbi:MAG: extracellular solute-binding protein [Candidatus Thermoplasmatota archaeon]